MSAADMLETFTRSPSSGYLNTWVSEEGLLCPRTILTLGSLGSTGSGEVGGWMPNGWIRRQKILGDQDEYLWAFWRFLAAGRTRGGVGLSTHPGPITHARARARLRPAAPPPHRPTAPPRSSISTQDSATRPRQWQGHRLGVSWEGPVQLMSR